MGALLEESRRRDLGKSPREPAGRGVCSDLVMLLAAQTKGQLELDVVLGAAGRGLGERACEGTGWGVAGQGGERGGHRHRDTDRPIESQAQTKPKTEEQPPNWRGVAETDRTGIRGRRGERESQDSAAQRQTTGPGSRDRPGAGGPLREAAGAGLRRGMEMGWQNESQTLPCPPQPARPWYLVSLLLAHGQGQLELQLLLPAALRPRLLSLRWGPRAHCCRGGCGGGGGSEMQRRQGSPEPRLPASSKTPSGT